MKKTELATRLGRITRVGSLSYALGVVGLILAPIIIWAQSEQPGVSPATIILLVILSIIIGLFFIFIGKSIVKSNHLLKTKLWALILLTLPIASGIIPLILFIYGIIGLYNAYKLSDVQLAERMKKVKK